MAYEIEYRNLHPSDSEWEKSPTKNNGYYAGYDKTNSQKFRITADTLEEFGIAIDKFLTQRRVVDWYWTRIETKYESPDISEFPSRTLDGKWEKIGRVDWKDNRYESYHGRA